MKRLAWVVVVVGLASVAAAADAPKFPKKFGPVTAEELPKAIEEHGENAKPVLHCAALKRGHVGYLPYWFEPRNPTPFVETSVLQVLNNRSMLLTVSVYGLNRPIRIVGGKEVAGPEQPRIEETVTLWIDGIDTSNTADGRKVELPGCWQAKETTSYESALGKRTVWKLVPYDIRRE